MNSKEKTRKMAIAYLIRDLGFTKEQAEQSINGKKKKKIVFGPGTKREKEK